MKGSELFERARRRREVIAHKRFAARVEMTPQEARERVDKIVTPKSMYGHPTDAEGKPVGKAGRTLKLIEKWRAIDPLPVGEQFRDFVRQQLSQAGYIWGCEDAISDTATDISYNFGFDPQSVVYVTFKGMKAESRMPRITQAASNYGPVKYPSEEGIYSTPEEHSRYCPEHAGIMMARKSDNVYHCPINKDGTFSYTDGGHEVKFETGVHQQISPSMNANREPKPTFLSGRAKDLEIIEKDAYDFEKIYSDPKAGHEEPEARKTQTDGPEQILCTEKKTEKKAEKSLTRTANADTMSNLFGPVATKTRFCPDHSDVQVTRIADCVYQCPIDGTIYNWEAGFTKQNGTEVPGASVANMTPDLPGYYSSPHVI